MPRSFVDSSSCDLVEFATGSIILSDIFTKPVNERSCRLSEIEKLTYYIREKKPTEIVAMKADIHIFFNFHS